MRAHGFGSSVVKTLCLGHYLGLEGVGSVSPLFLHGSNQHLPFNRRVNNEITQINKSITYAT